MSAAWDDLVARCAEFAHLRSVAAIAEWDQQVNMPGGGAVARGEQLALLAGLLHARTVDPGLSDAVETVALTASSPLELAVVRELRRRIQRAVRVPAELVTEASRVQAEAFHAWIDARRHNDFGKLAPSLARVFDVKRRTAAAIDSDRHPYDVLLEEYEPGTTTASLVHTFDRLERGLRTLLDAVADKPAPPGITGTFPTSAQQALHSQLIGQLGYDLDCGRLDFSEHPFTIPIGAGDIRITTHLYEDDLLRGLLGTVHETGHALYEQGLPRVVPGSGVDEAASFGLHESQSRLWENLVARGAPFLTWLAPQLHTHLGVNLTPEQLFAAANPIRPSLIRVFADEATYNLHILIRFRLEVALLTGDLPIDELPAAWNDAYRTTLGVVPPSDHDGCLQDVHWPTGAIGYFPTYTLGNLFAASLGARMELDEPDLWAKVATGDFSVVLAWLRDRIHRHEHLLDAPDLVKQAVGARDGVEDLLAHLWRRQGALYGVTRPST